MNRIIDKFNQLTGRVRKGLAVFFGLCGILLFLDLFLHKHGDYWWNFFGFHTLFGFVACVVLVLVASWMRKPLMRDEHHYDKKSESKSESKSK